MKKALLIIACVLVLTSVALGRVLSPSPRRLVFAANPPLEVTWDKPLFTGYDNLLPGDPITTKEVTIKNTSTDNTQYDLYFGAVDTSFEEGDSGGLLHDELEVALTDGGTTTYWDGTLAALFQIARDNGCASVEDISNNENCAVDLGILLQPSNETTIEMSVNFDQGVGNDHQNAEVVFDLLTGFLAAGTVSGASIGPDGLLGLATGADLIYSVLASLAALTTGLYLRRRSSPEFDKTASTQVD